MGSQASKKARENRLREERERAGLSLIEASKAVGVNKSSLSRWERREVPVPDEWKEQFAGLYQRSVAHLFKWE